MMNKKVISMLATNGKFSFLQEVSSISAGVSNDSILAGASNNSESNNKAPIPEEIAEAIFLKFQREAGGIHVSAVVPLLGNKLIITPETLDQSSFFIKVSIRNTCIGLVYSYIEALAESLLSKYTSQEPEQRDQVIESLQEKLETTYYESIFTPLLNQTLAKVPAN